MQKRRKTCNNQTIFNLSTETYLRARKAMTVQNSFAQQINILPEDTILIWILFTAVG